MAFELDLAPDVDGETISRAFTTRDPNAHGRLVLRIEERISTEDGEAYTVGYLDIVLDEPAERTVGVGLIPAFESKDPQQLANDDYVISCIRFGFGLMMQEDLGY